MSTPVERSLRARLMSLAPFAAIAVAAWLIFYLLVRAQAPRLFYDSTVFLEIAEQPWSWAQLFYPKPPLVPLVYRAIGTDPQVIVVAQSVLAIVAWSMFGAALASVIERRSVRIAAVVIAALFAIAPTRIGFTHGVLSESINDSLQTIAFALAILLAARLGREAGSATTRTRLLAGTLLVVAILWMWTRDTNAVVVLVAVPAFVVMRWRAARRHGWLLAIGGLAIVNAMIVIWSTTVVPPATGLSVHERWPQDFTARKTYPTFNNISDRLRDPEAVAYFVERGMPQAEQLVLLGARDQEIYLDPALTPARRWIVERAGSTYVSWLVRHPIAHVGQILGDLWTFLGVHKQHVYMPPGWTRHTTVVRWVRAATETKIVVILLLLACPFAFRRTERHPVTVVAGVLILSGVIGCAASYYGDSLERARHCYAAGQQVIVGLVLAVLVRVDLFVRRRR